MVATGAGERVGIAVAVIFRRLWFGRRQRNATAWAGTAATGASAGAGSRTRTGTSTWAGAATTWARARASTAATGARASTAATRARARASTRPSAGACAGASTRTIAGTIARTRVRAIAGATTVPAAAALRSSLISSTYAFLLPIKRNAYAGSNAKHAVVYAIEGDSIPFCFVVPHVLPRLASILFAHPVDAGIAGLAGWLLDTHAIDPDFIFAALVRHARAALFMLAFRTRVLRAALTIFFHVTSRAITASAVIRAVGWTCIAAFTGKNPRILRGFRITTHS